MSRPENPKKKTLRHTFDDEATALLGEEISSGSDRTVVILTAAILEDYLQEYLSAVMPQCGIGEGYVTPESLFERGGPLKGFSGKIEIARAFGLIPHEAWWDLKAINNVRNSFAHHPYPLRFDQGTTESICKELKSVEDKALRRFLPKDAADRFRAEHGEPPAKPKHRWIEASAILSFYLIGRMFAEDVTKVARGKPGWSRNYSSFPT